MNKKSYKDAVFWEQKYKANCCQTYEWICTPQLLLSSIGSHINYNDISKILQIGCGTSTLAAKLLDEAAVRKKQITITCVDFSKQLIRKYRQKSTKTGTSIEYLCLDVRNMSSLPDAEFDCIFDKGCIDCLFCNDSFIKQVLIGLRECYRLLKDGGKLIMVSIGKPKIRSHLLRNRLVPFNLKVQKIMRGQSEIYAYVCTKGQSANNQAGQNGEVQPQHQSDDDHKSSQHNQQQKKSEPQKQQIDAPFILQDKNAGNKQKQQLKNNDNEAPFILDSPLNQENQAPFILSDDKNKVKQNKTALPNDKQGEKQIKSAKKEEEANFILDEAEYDNQFQQDV